MTSVRDIYSFIDSFAPFSSQMEFDNSGLQTGDFTQAVHSAMVCLDATPSVIEQAARAKCDLVIAHHPVLFHARRQLLSHDPAWLLARHNIACVASHTPLDICPGGVNDLLAQRLFPGKITRLNELIRLCTLSKPMSAAALAGHVSRRLNAPVRCCDAGRPIETVAICGGLGCKFIGEVIGQADAQGPDAQGVPDAFLTGDADHHAFLEAAQQGLTLLAAGHFETEIHIVPALAEKLRAAFPNLEWHIADEYGVIHYA